MFKKITATIITIASLTAGLAATTHAQSTPIPEQSQWLLSLDLKAAQQSKLLTTLLNAIDPARKQKAERQLQGFNAMFDIDLLNVIQRVVVAGASAPDQSGVAYIYGTLPQERITTILGLSKEYTSSDYHGTDLQSWFDAADKKTKFLAFSAKGVTLLSNNRESITAALDALDGRTSALPVNSPLALAHQNSTDLLTISAQGLATLTGAQPQVQMLKQAEALNLTVNTPDEQTLALKMGVATKDAATAQQLQQALVGIQALTMMNAKDQPDLAALAQQLSIQLQERKLDLSLNLNAATLTNLLKAYLPADKP